ncbi:MAG: hypothetical protein JW741_25700 [Sedimentisphaerales bacterium]|nr:hypothetical protein [Sedimentisphaerales bacterium]
MSFCTAINCMDGRTQLPVNEYLRRKLNTPYVDTITEPGPVRILGEEPDSALAESILRRVEVSVKKHGSQCVAVVAHWDCTGNPAPEDRQKKQLDLSVRSVAARYPNIRVLGLWVDSNWSVEESCTAQD